MTITGPTACGSFRIPARGLIGYLKFLTDTRDSGLLESPLRRLRLRGPARSPGDDGALVSGREASNQLRDRPPAARRTFFVPTR